MRFTIRKRGLRSARSCSLVATLVVMSVVAISAQQDRPLPVGHAEVGFLFDTVDRWTFEGEGQRRVRLAVESLAFDTVVEIRTPAGELVAENDDCSDSRDSSNTTDSCVEISIPETGSYQVRVAQSGVGTGGLYTIALQMLTNHALGGAAALPIGTPTIGQLGNDKGVGRWLFDTAGEQVVRVTAESNDFDTVIELRSSAGELLAENDDCADGAESSAATDLGPTDSCLETVVPGAGQYEISVTAYRREVGRYTVTVQATPVVGALENSDFVYASGEHYDEYAVEVDPGGTLVAEVESATFETYLTMISPAGVRTSHRSVTRDGLSRVRVVVTAAEPGIWSANVSSMWPAETGPYKLWLGASSAEPTLLHGELEAGDALGRDGEYIDVYPVGSRARGCLAVSLSGASGLRARVLGPAGYHAESAAIVVDNGTVVLDEVLSAEGPYRVLVTAAAQKTGRYALAIGECSLGGGGAVTAGGQRAGSSGVR